MVFQVMRRSALTSLNWDTVNTERLALIKKIILEQTAALLRSMAAARDATRATERTRSRRARPARIS
jgi:TetR/AcrR family transcriptional regulator, regulator of cefoperazone and chloramphenicol sensitivity